MIHVYTVSEIRRKFCAGIVSLCRLICIDVCVPVWLLSYACPVKVMTANVYDRIQQAKNCPNTRQGVYDNVYSQKQANV